MRNIVQSATELQAVEAISSIVHGPTYASFNENGPFNFAIMLHKTRRSQGKDSRGRTGVITFPFVEIGDRFLRDCGELSEVQIPIRIGSKRIIFTKSRFIAKKSIVEKIKREPFSLPTAHRTFDPSVIVSEDVLLQSVRFGRLRRDDVFSIEWEFPSGDNNLVSVKFDADMREMQVIVQDIQKLSGYSEGDLLGNRVIAIKYSQVELASFYTDEETGLPSILIYLIYTPLFLHTNEIQRYLSLVFSPPGNTYKSNRRTSHKNGQNQRIPSYTSLHLQLLCKSADEFLTQQKKQVVSGITHTTCTNRSPTITNYLRRN